MTDLALMLVRILLGGFFLLSALLKFLGGRKSFASSVRAFGIPGRLAWLFALIIPPLEAALALAVLFGPLGRLAASVMGVLLGAFTLAAVRLLWRGDSVNCGCFGPSFTSIISWKFVVRNLVLMCLAGGLAMSGLGSWVL